MFKHIIYIEKDVEKYTSTQNIIQKLQPPHIEIIDHYKEVLNQPNSNWLFNKAYQKIILAKRKDEFYYNGSALTHSIGFKHFYYNTLALNCLYHCEYCYLQGMYNTPHIVLFLNNNDFLSATKQLIKKINDKIYLALSYDTDLPALEKYYPYCQEWIDFANKQKLLNIEIRTKSNQLSFLNHCRPSDNVLLSFTLSPDIIQQLYEPFTPSLTQRLNAIKTALNNNFNVMLCFDPLIHIQNFQDIYSDFFEKIFKEINPSSIKATSVGTFRMNNEFLKRIRKNGNTSDLYFYQYEVKNKIVTYPESLKNDLIIFVKKELSKYNIQNIFVYE
ncbi:MAG: spore photoproduct lyase family protein [Bacteroidota bacterium]